MKLCSRLFVLYCRSRPKDDKSRHIDPHFEKVRGGVEPWLTARWKARAEFLLSVCELLFLSLTVEALKNWTQFANQQCKLHCATCRSFDNIPACDGQAGRRTDGGQSDGIAVASTARAMRAVRRAVKRKTLSKIKKREMLNVEHAPSRTYLYS